MHALNLFTRFAPNRTFIALVLGLISGLLYSLLIPIIMLSIKPRNNSIEGSNLTSLFGFEISNWGIALLFITTCIAIVIFSTLSSIVLTRMALDIRSRLRKDIYHKINNASVVDIDRVGNSRLLQALATDVPAIIAGAQALPSLVINSVIVLSMLIYLLFLDSDVFYFVTKAVVIGSFAYLTIAYFGNRYFKLARVAQDHLQAAFLGAVGGVKELKLSKKKYKFFEENLLSKEELKVRDLQKRGQTFYIIANNLGDTMFFITIGIICFVLVNSYHFSQSELVAIVMVILYLSGPIGMILNLLPTLSIANISVQKLKHLFEELPCEGFQEFSGQVPKWSKVTLKDIEYTYPPAYENQSKVERFGVGPIDLTIETGEVTFIVGGNGSGKSTISKVISLLYMPTSGNIEFDGIKVTEENINTYRQSIVTIFSDYHLFPKVLMPSEQFDGKKTDFENYLKFFGLADKVSVSELEFSTLELSDGQRRRLALTVAMLETPQLFIFDEWAADQDPEFKQIFYNEVLPFLREQGSAVLIISHDERYFSSADKVIYVESGKLAKTSRISKEYKTNP